MKLTGKNLIAGIWKSGAGGIFTATSALDGTTLPGDFHEASPTDAMAAVTGASEAFATFRRTSPKQRSGFLNCIADEILALGNALIERCQCETALPVDRLLGERARTVAQLRLFAEVALDGSWVDARLDLADPARTPQPKPDLRRSLVPIGPIVVFGASNFPLAFSVAGGDTASALATGNPVVVKAHEAHPGTSELVGTAISRAVEACGLPPGVFSMLHGPGRTLGPILVQHSSTRAVALTGSLGAGRALIAAAMARPDPIPVFAEMGSVNPVFVLSDAIKQSGRQIAEKLCASVAMGVGQFCTKPGLFFATTGEGFREFQESLRSAFAATMPARMLHGGICGAFHQGVQRVKAVPGVTTLSVSARNADASQTHGTPCVMSVDLDTFLTQPALAEEIFGPYALLVKVRDVADMERAADALAGQLTGSFFATDRDIAAIQPLLEHVAARVGRIIFNAVPTGVEVCHAMQHGGPWPATSDSRFTSVGSAALLRFVRPLCLQNAPASLLPPELRDENPHGIWRMVNGHPTREPIRADLV